MQILVQRNHPSELKIERIKSNGDIFENVRFWFEDTIQSQWEGEPVKCTHRRIHQN